MACPELPPVEGYREWHLENCFVLSRSRIHRRAGGIRPLNPFLTHVLLTPGAQRYSNCHAVHMDLFKIWQEKPGIWDDRLSWEVKGNRFQLQLIDPGRPVDFVIKFH